MPRRIVFHLALSLMLSILIAVPPALAEDDAPWGTGNRVPVDYAPHKVLYDVSTTGPEQFENVLDRASYLNNVYHADPFAASIVLVLHGDEIPLFDVRAFDKHAALVRRAQSLTLAGPVEIRMCRIAAEGHGLKPENIHGFVKIVPMADAEIVRLQQEEGYAYMR